MDSTASQEAAPFRPIQYLGSKQRLAQTIAARVDSLVAPQARVGDLFAGSGVVSQVVGALRPVTAVDIQAYSQVLTNALLKGRPEHLEAVRDDNFWRRVNDLTAHISEIARPVLELEQQAYALARNGDAGKLVQLIENGSLTTHRQLPSENCPPELASCLKAVNEAVAKSGFHPAELSATLYFGGPYFSYAQAIAFDAITIAAGDLDAESRTSLSAVLLSSASEIVNTVGKQFAQPIKLVKKDGRVQPLLLERALRDRGRSVEETFRIWADKWKDYLPCGGDGHNVVCGDVINFVDSDRSCDIYYADPPYTIDHYSRFYHVLETLIKRDSPQLATMKKSGTMSIMRGVYRTDRYQSPFCIPSAAAAAFDRLLASVGKRSVPLLLSYSPFDDDKGHRPRLLTITELIGQAKKYFGSVEVVEISEHSHRKLNAKAMNSCISSDAERLIICQP